MSLTFNATQFHDLHEVDFKELKFLQLLYKNNNINIVCVLQSIFLPPVKCLFNLRSDVPLSNGQFLRMNQCSLGGVFCD